MKRAKYMLVTILILGLISGLISFQLNKLNIRSSTIYTTTIFNLPATNTVYGTVTSPPFASTTQRYYVTFVPGALANYYTYIYIYPTP